MSAKTVNLLPGVVLLLASASAPVLSTTDEATDSPLWNQWMTTPVVERAVAGLLPSTEKQTTDNYLWTNSDGFARKTAELVNAISAVADDGLNPEHYQFSELQSVINTPLHELDRALVEERLTDVFVQLVSDLGQGVVDPTEVQKRWFEKPTPVDTDLAVSLLSSTAGSLSTLIDRYRPQSNIYKQLSAELRYYRQLERMGGPAYIPEGPSIRPGEADPRISAIRDYLELTRYLDPAPGADLPAYEGALHSDVLTPELVTAVTLFQQRHGLEADGIVGKKTVAVMNVPMTDRVNQIKLNLERLRWFTRTPGQSHLLTNIPAYRLDYRVDDQSALSMPVVVGKKKFMTPVFSDTMRSIVFNPNWNVPRSIADRELIPRELEDPGYLARNNYELIRQVNDAIEVTSPNDIAIATYQSDNFPYTIRQRPGTNNALGKLKFLFPNPYSIYLHDTPAKSLFKRHKRAYSHGCIRVEQPKTLAQTILEKEAFKTSDVDRLYNAKKTKWISLDEPLPNHIVYWTTWVDENQALHFAEDIYGHDAPLLAAMGSALLPTTTPAETQPVLIADTGDME